MTMCGRFYIEPEGDLREMLREANRKQLAVTGQESVAGGEIFPCGVIAALAHGRNGNSAVYPMRWGYTLNGKPRPVINARSETAAERPMFRDSWQTRRCLIPADRYFEWERDAGKKKQKYGISVKKPGPIFLAGLYRYEPTEPLPACVILTAEPAEEIRFIHDRMPVIFSGDEAAMWLTEDPAGMLFRRETDMVFEPAG